MYVAKVKSLSLEFHGIIFFFKSPFVHSKLQTYGKIIILERFLPSQQKTIKPVAIGVHPSISLFMFCSLFCSHKKSGDVAALVALLTNDNHVVSLWQGMAGGEKYICQGRRLSVNVSLHSSLMLWETYRGVDFMAVVVVFKGILFKFAVDSLGLYGGDEYSQKAGKLLTS